MYGLKPVLFTASPDLLMEPVPFKLTYHLETNTFEMRPYVDLWQIR
jgi:hypothetical protein